ncbi:MAG: MFS transporter [Pseudomonadota bacterium]
MSDKRTGVIAVIGSSIAIFLVGGFIFGLPGVMAPHWQEKFQVGRGDVGNTMMFLLAAVGICMFFVGHWQERVGTRIMILIGVVSSCLDIVFLAFAESLSMVYLWAFIIGAASAFIYLPGLTTVQKWFPERRGLVSGIFNLTFGISGAVMSPVFTYLPAKMGYSDMIIMMAAVTFLIGIPAALASRSPESLGSVPSSGPSIGPPIPLGPSLSARQSLFTRSFRMLWLTWVLQGSAGVAMLVLAVQYGLSMGLPLASAGIILTAFNVTNGMSRLIMGYLSDKMNRVTAMSATFFASGIAYLILPHVNGLYASAFLAAVVGFAFGTLFSVSGPLIVDCFGIRHFGGIFGLMFTAYGFFAGPLGPSLSGYILDATNGNFFIVFTYLGVFCTISGVLVTRVTPVRQL